MDATSSDSMVGFDLLYKTYTERQSYPELYETPIIRKVAESMYAFGVLDGAGKLSGVKTPRGLVRRVTEVRNRMKLEIEKTEMGVNDERS